MFLIYLSYQKFKLCKPWIPTISTSLAMCHIYHVFILLLVQTQVASLVIAYLDSNVSAFTVLSKIIFIELKYNVWLVYQINFILWNFSLPCQIDCLNLFPNPQAVRRGLYTCYQDPVMVLCLRRKYFGDKLPFSVLNVTALQLPSLRKHEPRSVLNY